MSSDLSLDVSITTDTPSRNWSFRNAYATSIGLGERVEQFRCDAAIAKKIASGEFVAEVPSATCSYRIELRHPEPGGVAHVSWLAGDHGVLMLADLLPVNIDRSVELELEMPPGWTVRSTNVPTDRRKISADAEKAVFLVGRDLRISEKRFGSATVELTCTGQWPFDSKNVLEVAIRILKRYSVVTGFPLTKRLAVMVAPLPVSSVNQWKAETRDATVVLLINPAAHFSTWSGQLGVILSHELFHYWVPNSLRLEGDYDWFFEGFTLYQALLTALDLKLITFHEYLATIARSYDSYLSYPDNISLLRASEERWTSGGSFVYDKGMLVAFMYDMELRRQSGNRSNILELYKKLFAGYGGKPAVANTVIIELLASLLSSREFEKRYVEGVNSLGFESFLLPYGLRVDSGGDRTTINIQNPNSDQMKILRSLGYKK